MLSPLGLTPFIRLRRPAWPGHARVYRCRAGHEICPDLCPAIRPRERAHRAHFLKIFEQLRERVIRETLELPAISEYIESKRLIDGQVKALAARMGRKPVLIEERTRDQALQSSR